MFNKIALSGVPNGINNFSFGMLFSVIFHGSIFVATIFALPFVVKKPIELLPSISVELIQISEQMNIPYAPKAAKIIEKAKTENKKLLSEQAPPKEIKKEINKQVKFDNQKDVLNECLTLLSGGIDELAQATSRSEPFDLYFNGDKDKWVSAAYTLKARINLVLKDYAAALSDASMGISSSS